MRAQILKTTGGKLHIKIPEHLHEVTLGQLIEMQSTENMSDLEAIQILSGIPMSELQNIKNFGDLQLFNNHVAALSLQIKNLYNSESLPKTITFTIDGKPVKVKVISNLSIEPAGAFLAARDVITEEINDHIEQHGDNWQANFNPSLKTCAMLLAHYFYCTVSGNWYNEYKAEEFYDEVIKLPFTDALPIAKYFFLNYPNLSKPKISCWLRVQLLWKKRLALSRFKNSGMLTQ
ncbi:hypothetical protein [Mucilaginibacter polytrichastri]|uniref:Uncharacterized protein n=1 Tax=Mucilaginibacter polytrichastri TaxID=1302689 RepID=A0A1Q5ZSV5_9SPHI|nr:hypothetical protein [Mucilaginibacter polytrichastri]OKS84852.1 hypothetical protein RG47T_0289 [Mucilaginibacter polytrichastri]SFS48647.1 hypothetical protein SAMN04487890_101785 [Mucilaginibacter polytrichastri]